MIVKFETDVLEYLKARGLPVTCAECSNTTGIDFHNVWNALVQLEQKGSVFQNANTNCWGVK